MKWRSFLKINSFLYIIRPQYQFCKIVLSCDFLYQFKSDENIGVIRTRIL